MQNDTIKYYKLKLSDDRVWEYCSTEKLVPWLNEFATILQLRPCSPQEAAYRRLLFIPYKSAESPSFNAESWELYKSGSIFRLWHHSDIPEIFIELDIESMDDHNIKIINMWNALKPLYRHYAERGGGPMHAALAGLNGNGFLIAAPGNTGKSTSISRLPENYERQCDDTALIVKTDNNYRVHPTPTWSDYFLSKGEKKTFNIEKSLPLKAVFFLEQSDKDEVIPIDPGKAASKIFAGHKQSWMAYWHRMDTEIRKKRQLQIFNNSIQMAKSVPCYRLKATLHGKFWEKIEKFLG